MKKYLMILALIATNTQASECVQKTGFFAGARAGVELATLGDLNLFGQNQSVKNATGFAGELFTGYQALFNQFLVGGEIFVNLSSTKLKSSFADALLGTVDASQQKQMGIGAALSLGMLVTKSTEVHAKLGIDYAKWKTNINAALTAAGAAAAGIPGGAAVNVADSQSKSVLGLSPGLGFSTMIAPHVKLSADYKFTMWKSPIDGGPKPKTHSFLVGVAWQF